MVAKQAAGPLERATQRSLRKATHLKGDEYALLRIALVQLARKIDGWDNVVQAANEYAAERGTRPTVPQMDNVSSSAFFKACEQLGLTPAARLKLPGAAPSAAPAATEVTTRVVDPGGDKSARITALRSGVR
jgi:hypothetical protein